MSDAVAPERPRPVLAWAAGAAVLLIIALLPIVLHDSYWRGVLVIAALNVMLALGLDFILGYTGQLNLGISAFYGIGAYASTLLVTKAGMPFWPALLAGTGIGAWPPVEAACEATIRPTEVIQPQNAAVMSEAYQRFRRLYPALRLVNQA